MKKLKPKEIIYQAERLSEKQICFFGVESAEQILKLALEKTRAKRLNLKAKYK